MIVERIVCRLCGEAFDDVNEWWWHHLRHHSDKVVGPLALALHFKRARQPRARRLEALLEAEGEGWVEVVRARGGEEGGGWAEVTAVVRFCGSCARYEGGRCALTGWQVLPTRPACPSFSPRHAQLQLRQVAPLTSTIPAPPPRFRRVISLCRRRPVRRKPDYFAYTVNVPIDAVRAWAGGGEPPRKLIATFDGRRLVLEPPEGVVGE